MGNSTSGNKHRFNEAYNDEDDTDSAPSVSLKNSSSSNYVKNQQDKTSFNSTTTSSSSLDYDYLIKPVLVGDSGTGKTICMHRLSRSEEEPTNTSTIGVDYKISLVEVMIKGKPVRLKVQFWDTAGQERFRTMTTMYFNYAHIVIVLYDVTIQTSFDNVTRWITSVREKNQDAKIILVGNKIDLVADRVVSTDQGLKLASEFDADFVEVSNTKEINIKKLEKLILENSINYIEKREFSTTNSNIIEATLPKTPSFNSMVSRKRQAIERSENDMKLHIVVQVTDTGLKNNEENFWKALFPKHFPIDYSTTFKIYEKYNAITIDNIRENCKIDLYFINQTNLTTFIVECKQIYRKSTFKDYEFRVVDASIIYKKVCHQMKIKPEPNIASLFEVIDESHNTLNFRGAVTSEPLSQKSAIFKSMIWVYSLKSIDLGYNNIGDSELKELCMAIHHMNNISELYLNGNTGITQNGCIHLVNILIDNNLKKLVLSGCNIGSHSAIPLISCIPSSTIEVLDFSACSLDSEFSEKFIQLYFVRKQGLLKYNLQELRLFMNEKIDVELFLGQKDCFSGLKIDILQYHKPKPQIVIESKPTTENSDNMIKGRYRIDKFIKKGGFGKVYLCTDMFEQSKSKQVAVKMVTFYDISELEGHIKEISHQNLIKNEALIAPLLSIEMNSQENKLYLIMPYFKLGDLSGIIYDRFLKKNPFGQDLIVKFLLMATQALSYLLNNNIVHRDIKPSNFLISKYTDTDLECVLSDFGLATSVSNTQMLVDDTSCTTKYAPPELNETGTSTFKGDVFSLGCTLYEMMSLDSNTTIWNLIKSQGEANTKTILKERIEKNCKEYSDQLISLTLSLLENDPEKRPDYQFILDTITQLQ